MVAGSATHGASYSVGGLTAAVVVGVIAILIGQGLVRNVQVFENVYMRQHPVEPALRTKRYRQQEVIGKIVGWWFTAAGSVSLTVGLVGLIIWLVRGIAHAV